MSQIFTIRGQFPDFREFERTAFSEARPRLVMVAYYTCLAAMTILGDIRTIGYVYNARDYMEYLLLIQISAKTS